jgi:ribosomal protein L2
MLHRGHSKNFYFSQVPNKSSWLLGKNDDFAKVLLPSKKVIFLNLHSTKASKANIVSDVLLLTPKHNKKSFYGRKPFVRGKAMNVFDHPNGGYKHSSKLLKTFKGKKIYK